MPRTFASFTPRASLRFAIFALAVAAVGCGESPADTHQRAAIELFKNGDYARAAAEYEQVIALNPQIDERVKKKTAQAWARAHEYGKAAVVLQKIADGKQGDEHINGYKDIAAMYLNTANDPDKAEEWFTKALEMAPKDSSTITWLAEIASIRGGARSTTAPAKLDQLDLALKRYDEALELKPDSIGAYVSKRIVYTKYLDALNRQRTQLLADAEANKKDKKKKDLVAQNLQTADDLGKKIDSMKADLDKTNAKLGELMKAAKTESPPGAAPTAPPAPPAPPAAPAPPAKP